MEFDERYRIIQSRDPRFDGQFITAVSSTGIYCRPSCPARTPRAGNVTFYETSAAAHEAGYRACKRCLPEAVPGTPAWNLRDDLAARAMRLIADGAIERGGVDGLAARLGYSPRHLTRVLTAELGAGPLALARAHRAQTARTLLTATDLPIADVAFAAGFSSVRQFNETVAEVFQLTPTRIRESRPRSAAPVPGSLTLTLPYRVPYDAAGVFAWLAARALPGIEDAGAAHYSRSLALPGGPAWFTVRPAATGAGRGAPAGGGPSPRAGAALVLEAHLTSLGDLPALVARVRRLFDLDADPLAIDQSLAGGAERAGAEGLIAPDAAAALTAHLAATPGIRLPGAVDPHEMLFRALLGQQITVAAARTLLHRLALAAGTPYPSERALDSRASESPALASAAAQGTAGTAASDGDAGEWRPTLLFPTAAQIAAHAATVLTGPRAKIATVIAVAEALAAGTLDLSPGDDPVELHDRLVALPGIGDWTAGYLAMRVLGAPDVLLTGDVALRNGARALGLPDAPRALRAWSPPFAPWRSYLSLHLWRAAASPASRLRKPTQNRSDRSVGATSIPQSDPQNQETP